MSKKKAKWVALVCAVNILAAALLPGVALAANYIGTAEAKSIALSDFGVNESQVSKLKAELEREKGVMVYEVEFKLDRKEYEYEIDATSGAVVKAPSKPKLSQTVNYVGDEKAKSIALADFDVSEAEVSKLKAELDREKNVMVYEVEFKYDHKEYEYEINAESGAIVKAPSKPKPQQTENYIGESMAKSIALKAAGLTESQVSKLKVELERKKGATVYEVEFKYGRREYEYKVDAVSGALVR
jgi:uncharacterized membrane protein YkoI